MTRYANYDVPALIVRAVKDSAPINVRVNNISIRSRVNGDVEIFSYFTRMALIIKDGPTNTHAVVNSCKYSRTTSRHMSLINQGIAHAGIFSVAFTGEPPLR